MKRHTALKQSIKNDTSIEFKRDTEAQINSVRRIAVSACMTSVCLSVCNVGGL